MFQSITIKSKESSQQKIDIGFLAECLLFYKTVNILADRDSLTQIFSFCGIDNVRELIKRGYLNLYVREDILGVSMFPSDDGELLNFDKYVSESVTQEKLLFEGFQGAIGSDSQSKILTDEFLQLTNPYTYKESVITDIATDLKDKEYLAKAIAASINYWNSDNLISATDISASYFEVGTFGPFSTHKLETNVDFEKYKNVSPSGIILNIAEARGMINIAADFDSEIADKPVFTSILQTKIDSVVSRSLKSQQEISSFQDIVLPDFTPVHQAIQNKEVPFGDFLQLLEKAEKFKHWLQKVDEDKKIVAEYYKAVLKETWFDKLPGKGTRFAIFTAAGLIADAVATGGIGTIISTAVSAGDTFILDKLLKGWKPNQFIDELSQELPLKEESKH